MSAGRVAVGSPVAADFEVGRPQRRCYTRDDQPRFEPSAGRAGARGGEVVIRAAGEPAPIPTAFLDLVECPPVAALTTIMPDGSPQTSVVWCDFDGGFVRVNTMRGFRKEKNMRANPRVTLLCFDPARPLRSLEIRGLVEEMTEEGASVHLDGLSLKYTGLAPYFGRCIPEEFKASETPVLCRIRPTRIVTLDCEEPR
jgi:PPOX class probable F420-dependent enzyme